MLSPVTALALGFIGIGVIALLALRGNDVGIFHPLSMIGTEGAYSLIASGGFLLVASLTLMIREAYSLLLVRRRAQEDMEKHTSNWGPIFDQMDQEGYFKTGSKVKYRGRCCMWSDPNEPTTQFLCIQKGSERKIEVYHGNTAEEATDRLMERVVDCTERGIQLASTPVISHGINLKTIQQEWSSDPTEEDMRHYDECREAIMVTFLSFRNQDPENVMSHNQKIVHNGYIFTLKAQGELRSLQVDKSPKASV